MLKITTLGAGGGTIGWIGPGGLLKAGPHSAGASPGPACYGRGGTEATVTDADALMGYIDPDRLLGGRLRGDRAAAIGALERLGTGLGLDAEQTAIGFEKVITTNMAIGVRLALTEFGIDPRAVTLVALGGAGPVHACAVAQFLAIPRVLVPPYPGNACASGLLQTDVRHVYVRSRLGGVREIAAGDWREMYRDLEDRAIADGRAEGFDRAEIGLQHFLDVRYPRQGYELTVPATVDIDDAWRTRIEESFHTLHEQVYGIAARTEPVEIVNFRVTSEMVIPKLGFTEIARGQRDPARGGEARDAAGVLRCGRRLRRDAGLRPAQPARGEQDRRRGDHRARGLHDRRRVRCEARRRPVRQPVDPPAAVRRMSTVGTAPARLDPITLEIVGQRIAEIVSTMEVLLFHSGYSTILRESNDGSATVLDRAGRVVIGAGSPGHIAAYSYTIRGLLERYPWEKMRERDAFILNDPYLGGMHHVPDMAVITPVFWDGKPLGFCATIAHKSDVGGLVPGSSSASAREIYHEGTLIPPIRYWTAEGAVDDAVAIVSRNSRTPELVAGDIRAQLGATRMGEQRVHELVRQYGYETIAEAMERLQEISCARVGDELARWPDGVGEGEAFLDSDGVDLERRVRFHAKVTKRGRALTVDFSGSDAQVAGPVNLRPQSARDGQPDRAARLPRSDDPAHRRRSARSRS